MDVQTYLLQQALAQPASSYGMLSADIGRTAEQNKNRDSENLTPFGNWRGYEDLLKQAGFDGGFMRSTFDDSERTVYDPGLREWIDANRTGSGDNYSLPTDFSGYYTGQGYDVGRMNLPGNQYLDRVFRDGQGTDAYRLGTYSDPEFAIASKLAMAVMTGGAAAAGLGTMGGTIGSSLGMGGQLGTAIGNGLLNTGMTAATGGNISEAIKNGAISAGGAYLGQQAGGGLMNSLTGDGGGTIEPNFFAPGGPGDQGMFDFTGGGSAYTFDGWGTAPSWEGGLLGTLGDQFGDYDMPTNAQTPGWTWGGGLGGTLGDQPGDYDMPTNDPSPGWTGNIGGGLLGGAWNAVKGFLGDKGNAQLAGGLLGALAGASGAGDKQKTQQERMDPRMEPFIYGQGGLLGGAADWFSRNRGGNPLMQEGAQMQADFFKSPQYTHGFNQLRDRGLSLLGGQIAGNPFMPQQMNTNAAPPMQTPQLIPPQQPMPQAIPQQPGGRMTIMPVRGNYY